MKFIIDAQLPPALAQCLVRLNHEAVHVVDLGLLDADDRTILQHAIEQNCVVITKDEDFTSTAFWRKNHPAVVWLRIGNCSNQALLDWFIPILPDVVRRLQEGERLIEVNLPAQRAGLRQPSFKRAPAGWLRHPHDAGYTV